MFKRLVMVFILALTGLLFSLSHFALAQGGESDVPSGFRKIATAKQPQEFRYLQSVSVQSSNYTTKEFPYNSYGSGNFFFPPYSSENDRMGYGQALVGNPSVLRAGWYMDWNATMNPAHPGGAEYARTIYFSTHDTGKVCNPITKAPAIKKSQVTTNLTGTALISDVKAHPGALWLIGNEPDTVYNGSSMKAELYADFYHYFYTTIKAADPTAKVAIGAISQPSPVRMDYLDKILNYYRIVYGQPFPTDLWNIHFYYLNEKECDWGVSLPPFGDPERVRYLPLSYFDEGRILDLNVLEDNLRDFRQWMYDRGYRDVPLIITEYGVLPPAEDYPVYTNEKAALFLRDTMQMFRTITDANFITGTLDLTGSLIITDAAIGYPADDYRLVQMWNWFSTRSDVFGGDLFDEDGNLTIIGMAFGYESLSHFTPYVNLEVITPFTPTLISNTLTWDAFINNRGNITATDLTVSSTLINYFDGAVISSSIQLIDKYPPRYRQKPRLTAKVWPFTPPAAYTMTMSIDAYQTDVVTSNNQVEDFFALYPDLAVISFTNPTVIDWRKNGVTNFVTATISVSATIANVGNWTSTLTPMAMRLQSFNGAMSDTIALTVPILAPQGVFSLTQSWIVSDTGAYTASVLVNYPYQATRELFAHNNIATTRILIPNHWAFLPIVYNNYSISTTAIITPP